MLIKGFDALEMPHGIEAGSGRLLAHGFCCNGDILRILNFWAAMGCRKVDGGKSPSLSKQMLVFVMMIELQRVRYVGIRDRTAIKVQPTVRAY